MLADELIPSGEALVRNLLTGRRTLERFGAVAPSVLYCPDSFGHPASLPAIAAGFGLDVIVLWRGYGSRRFPPGDAAWWRSPTGERVLLYHLAQSGYELGSNLPTDSIEAERRWSAIREQLAPRSTTGVVLLPHGADHHARQLGHAEAVRALETAGVHDTVHRSSLRAFQRALVGRAERATLPLVEGELRDSYGYTWTLSGTLATRAHEKRFNALAERALATRRRTVERARVAARSVAPRVARRGVANAARGAPARHPLRLLHRRSRGGDGAAGSIRHESGGRRPRRCNLRSRGHDQVEARTSRDAWQPVVLIRNPAPRRGRA